MAATLNRRQFVFHGTVAAAAAMASGPLSRLGMAASNDEEVIPFLDPQPIKPNSAAVKWEDLTEWITPAKDFFDVSHYGKPAVDVANWKLQIGGLVATPKTLTLPQIKELPKKEVTATLECSGNGASSSFMGAIGNAKWTGTPLSALLKEFGVKPQAIEVAFWAADKGKEKIRNNDYEQHFARSLSLVEAQRPDVLLAYEMNGQPLNAGHGAPLRLIVPGWYGIAWVKWLTTIELRDHRLMNRFMARDYVTLRGTPTKNGIDWKESSVGPMNVKSLVARVLKNGPAYTVSGAAWTNAQEIQKVELKIDDGPWQTAALDERHREPHCWTFWSYEWQDARPGEHTLVSRAIDSNGDVQPAADDPLIKNKKTYWEANAQYPRRIRLT